MVNYAHVTKEDLEIKNKERNTAFCMAVIAGYGDVLETMIQKNKNVQLIRGPNGMLPIHLAVSCHHSMIAKDLWSEDLIKEIDFKDVERLLFIAINSDMCEIASLLVSYYGGRLISARDDEDKTALHLLALKPLDSFIRGKWQLMVFSLWAGLKNFEDEQRLKLITKPSVLLFDAIKLGNLEFLQEIIRNFYNLSWEVKDPETGQSLLHTAVLFRQSSIIYYLLEQKYSEDFKRKAVDKGSNNILHYAARQIQEARVSLRPDLQMKRELEWFQEVDRKFGSGLGAMRNKDGKTPRDVFHDNHMKLSDEVKDTAKSVAESGMVVAALIVAIAFAAALTTPGGENDAWFVVFIMANTAALFTSALSIVAFLSIFTSSTFKESDFIVSLYPSLIIGKRLLFTSLVTMLIAFVAASFLIFGHKYKWVAYVVTSFGVLTIIFIVELQRSVFSGLLGYFFSRYIEPCLKSIKFHTNQLACKFSDENQRGHLKTEEQSSISELSY